MKSISVEDFDYEEVDLTSYKDSLGNLKNIDVEEYNIIDEDDSNMVKEAKEKVQREKLEKEIYNNNKNFKKFDSNLFLKEKI